jgi:serine/threonine protein kinase
MSCPCIIRRCIRSVPIWLCIVCFCSICDRSWQCACNVVAVYDTTLTYILCVCRFGPSHAFAVYGRRSQQHQGPPLQMPGNVVDDPLKKSFHIREVLGSGTDGYVMRGIARSAWSGPGRSVALKFLKDGGQDDWAREAAILKKMQHPHIVPLLGAFPSHMASGRREYVLVFPERETVLSAFLRRRAGDDAIPSKVVQQFATQLLSALEHMHFRGILHRDLKPANILMKWNSLSFTAGLVLEICDFGHAREAPRTQRVRARGKQEIDSVGRNVLQSIVGMTPGVCTYMYAAPEIWCNGFTAQDSYGYGVDVWSYGTIVFQMINIEPFIMGESESQRFASAVARLGPCPQGVSLGTRQAELTARALDPSVVAQAETTASLLSYGDPVSGSPWCHIAKAVAWKSRHRLSAKALLHESWLSDDSEKPDGPSSIAGPVRPKIDGPLSADRKRSWVTAFSPDPAMWTPEPVASNTSKCMCKGHCWTSGHRYRNGCDSCQVIENSNYCRDCECQLWGCHRPRNHGVWCHGHSKVFAALPFPLKAASAARAVLDDLIRISARIWHCVCVRGCSKSRQQCDGGRCRRRPWLHRRAMR